MFHLHCARITVDNVGIQIAFNSKQFNATQK